MTDKKYIVARLKQDLYGPGTDDETLVSYPTDVYLTGILFPQASEIAEEDTDQLQAEGQTEVDTNDTADDEVSLATVKRPASAGISFVIESDATPSIEINISAAVYRPRHGENSESEESDKKPSITWHRTSLTGKLLVNPDFQSKDYSASETGIPGLGLHIRTSPWDHRQLVTVAMINENRLPDTYERVSLEEITFFQTGLAIRCCDGTRFCPRPLGGSAIDEDTAMAKLIYRNVREYAVGHTCSAEWSGEDEVTEVRTTWLPSATVRTMSSEGVKEFAPLTSEEILSTRWLADTGGDELIVGLKKLPELYRQWYLKQADTIEGMDSELQPQAHKHIDAADHVRQRMESAISLLENDIEAQHAFRLANRAIQLQRQWAARDPAPLVWRPFQLGFFLLTLESTANGDHPDRNTADLLWFPTGGGKTEAYLGLIAFILFLRRIRHGEEGAGVSAFMRYTLRLLTVQQFQRAAAMICACDTLRQGHLLPKDIQIDLTDIPFALGLWVGRDTTPNVSAEAVTVMRDPAAHNRPDQLINCPHHTDTRLTWRSDSNEVSAFCDHPDCLWHNQPLPVWTVDESIYNRKPSLVIGTIDKFAQIARKDLTTNLFGNGTGYLQPDLIIQDELHLISGPLGTLAGVYETAIDRLCCRDGVEPKVVASTATIRQASEQIRDLFNRDTCLFPPPVLDSGNSGFAVADREDPGRQYLGLTTAGRSAKFALQATAASLMQTMKSDNIADEVRDEFWTLVTYFNSLRELGGALVLMQDDVGASMKDYADRHDEEVRVIREPMELTSRVSSSEIKEYLNRLEKGWQQDEACDVVLASNMISVGVDVSRLGAMIVNGQPKGIAEYIQATSRVGRRRDGPGGLVLTIYNNAKSRDRSHFETFNTWHMALYREVEATSVTPFAPRSREKALHAVLVILARHLIPDLITSASDVNDHREELSDLIDYVVERVEDIDPEERDNVEDALNAFLDDWAGSASSFKQYWNDRALNKSLMVSAEKAAEIKSRFGSYRFKARPTPNSMRNVEPGCSYVLEKRLR